MRRSRLQWVSIVSVAALAVTGACTNASPPTLPALSDIAEALAVNESEVVGSPTEVYARVARGAMSCWFATGGALKADYVYHAEAEPASKGGKSEIVIHERDRQSENPKGLRAFRISIVPHEETARIATENLKLPERLAKAMDHDVHRWAAGAIGCTEGNQQWSPEPPEQLDTPGSWESRGRGDRKT